MAYPSKTGLESDVQHEQHYNEIRVALALMLEAAMMMPVIFTNREMPSEFNSHKQPLDCLRNTGRPEKNSNNKQAVIDHTGRKTTKNRKIR